MKPEFALSLSFEGIGLLTRVPGGWHLLGEVTLDTEDLAGDLKALRDRGAALATGPFATAVVLPNDQIKYLTLDTGRAKEARRREKAAAALEENTPYRADQLSFDIHAKGRETAVAAVARETLEEAEAFAVEHNFNPVRFTAIPPEGAFAATPDFGPSATAASIVNGTEVHLDPEPIQIISQGPLAPRAEPGPGPAEDPQITQDTPPEPEAEEPASVTFASIRARRDTAPDPNREPGRALGGVTRKAPDTNAPSIPDDSVPMADRTVRFDPAIVAAGLKSDAGPRPEPHEAEEPTEKESGSFLTRRPRRRAAAPPEVAAPVADQAEPQYATPAKPPKRKRQGDPEKQRMTIFGARTQHEIGGKPRFLGLMLTAILLLLLAGVALWAALFLENGVAGLFRKDESPRIVMVDPHAATVPEHLLKAPNPDAPTAAAPEGTPETTSPAQQDPVDTALLAPANEDSITDSAEIEAMMDEPDPSVPSAHEAEARYAVTGIWERAPEPLETPAAGSSDELYATSIDRVVIAQDAVALPDPALLLSDSAPRQQVNPVSHGTVFNLDERGLVVARAEGALNPEGVMVYLGRPPALPKSLPDRSKIDGRALSREQETRIASIRPRLRPGNLVEQNQRATLGGRSWDELARIRPRLRPISEKEAAEKDTTPTALAVLSSPRPRQRPSNIAQLAQRATPSAPAVAVPASATVTPKIPTTASVARQATLKNAINLNKINLIGVYGTASNRRALVRMANGRYKKVQVGDRIDGGKVAAISDTELRYVKSGQNVVLRLPKG